MGRDSNFHVSFQVYQTFWWVCTYQTYSITCGSASPRTFWNIWQSMQWMCHAVPQEPCHHVNGTNASLKFRPYHYLDDFSRTYSPYLFSYTCPVPARVWLSHRESKNPCSGYISPRPLFHEWPSPTQYSLVLGIYAVVSARGSNWGNRQSADGKHTEGSSAAWEACQWTMFRFLDIDMEYKITFWLKHCWTTPKTSLQSQKEFQGTSFWNTWFHHLGPSFHLTPWPLPK